MKHALISLAVGLLTFGLFYLMGCFMSTSFNITTWSEDVRIFVAILGGIFGIAVILGTYAAIKIR